MNGAIKSAVFTTGPPATGSRPCNRAALRAPQPRSKEALAKRIDTSRYIRNALTGKSSQPVVTALDNDGKNEIQVERGGGNRFCFIERNRIDGFARLSAAGSKTQTERIAALFGMESFTAFVSNFTESIDDRYLPTANPLDGNLQNLARDIDAQKRAIALHHEGTATLPSDITGLLSALGDDTIKSIDDVETFLSGSPSSAGRIRTLDQEKRALEGRRMVDAQSINRSRSYVLDLQTTISELSVEQAILGKSASQLRFKSIYDAVASLAACDHQSTTCPACDTPLQNTTKNPFMHAGEQLQKMRELSERQEHTFRLQRTIEDIWQKLIADLHVVREARALAGVPQDGLPLSFENFLDQSKSGTAADLFTQLTAGSDLIADLANAEALILAWNEATKAGFATAERLQADIGRLQDLRVRSEKLRTLKNGADTTLKEAEDKLAKLEYANAETYTQHLQHQAGADRNRHYQSAYTSFRKRLGEYLNILPSKLATGLAANARRIYNEINSQDPDHWQLDHLSLPTSADEKIEIRFPDDSRIHDALHVLSEGNLKCLGLAILLAKATQQDVQTIIFDDVVNAIDDDHRDGIASLLIEDEQFQNRQMIITCHGEQFIQKIESKLGQRKIDKDSLRLRFLPPETHAASGVRLREGKPSYYLTKAQNALGDHDLKEAATFCRQALESLTYELWRKTSNKLKSLLTVQIRGPSVPPDLNSIVAGLVKETQSVDPELSKALNDIKGVYATRSLNKGAHHDGVEPETDANDIRELIDLLKVIESGILKFGKVRTAPGSKQRTTDPEQAANS